MQSRVVLFIVATILAAVGLTARLPELRCQTPQPIDLAP